MMDPRAKGKPEKAFHKAVLEIERIFSEAADAGVDTDALICTSYDFATRRMGLRTQPTAIKESVFELRLKSGQNSGEPPSQGTLQAGLQTQQSNGENQGHSDGPERAPNSSPVENRLFPEGWCRLAMAAILEGLSAIHCPAREGCVAAKQLREYARQIDALCNQSDIRELPLAASRPESCHEYLQTSLSCQKCRNYQFPWLALHSIVQLVRGKKQDAGGAA